MSSINMSPAKTSLAQTASTNRPDRINPRAMGKSTMKADFEKAAIAAGVDPSKLKDIENQIQSEMIKARSNPGSGFSLPAAIDAALKAGGANLDTFHATMQKLHDQRRQARPTPVQPAAAPKSHAAGTASTAKLDISI